MQILKTAVLVLCVTILFTACEKATDVGGTGDSITGTWDWENSSGGIAYQVHSPASTGLNKKVQFTSDGHYKFTTNDAVTASGTYSLEEKECIHSASKKKWIQFSNNPEENRMIESIKAYQLQLSDEAYDGFTATYTRTSKKGD